MYRNYIFDLYGTLVDIHTDEEKSSFWKKIALFYSMNGAAYKPIELKEDYRRKVLEEEERLREERLREERLREERQQDGTLQGDIRLRGEALPEIQLEGIFYSLYRDKGITPTQEMLDQTAIIFRTCSTSYIRLFPGVKQLLCRLHKAGKRIYLLSNAQRCFTEPEMKMLGIYDYFDGILYSSDAGVKKPSEEFFEQLFSRYCLQKEDSVMIGNDSVADIRGADNFGISSFYVHTSQSGERVLPFPDNCTELRDIRQVVPK